MKTYLITALTVFALLITLLVVLPSEQIAKNENDVAELALMLPETDVIVALDMNATLNVVGPDLLNHDDAKLANLKKLMKSLENTIGIDPYEIKQIVAGIKIPAPDAKNIFDNLDFTVIFRTASSNDALLESWTKKMDLIQAFELERKPSETYIDEFKNFRNQEIDKEEKKTLDALLKDFDEILKKANAVKDLLNKQPNATRATKLYKDSLKANTALIDLVVRAQKLLRTDTDVKAFHNSTLKLQNRWTEITLDDAQKTEKLAKILREAKAIYPGFKRKAEEVAKVDLVIGVSDYQFYEVMFDPDFDQFKKDEEDEEIGAPNEAIKTKLDEIISGINSLPTARFAQTKSFTAVLNTLNSLEAMMKIRLSAADESEKFTEIEDETPAPPESGKTFSETIKENAQISLVNGKRMITIDPEKLDLGDTTVLIAPVGIDSNSNSTDEEMQESTDEPLSASSNTMSNSPRRNAIKKEKVVEEDKKKEMFAIGYLDDTTMVLGFEPGIRSILNRKEGFRNPKAAEMVSSFRSPLISFASNSAIIKGLLTTIESKETKKKIDPVETFFSDINIFGAIEYDGSGAATNDISMSLGFTKNSVVDLFKPEEAEADDTVIEIGDYQLGEALFYDLLNTLKAYKASMSFKFEKKKLANLIEKVPEILENARSQDTNSEDGRRRSDKIRILSFEDILTSPKLYTDLARLLLSRK